MPYTDKIQKECYFRVNGESYVMTGFDQDASLGVLYISANSTYERDLTPAPEQTKEDKDEEFFWLNGGK